jgi:hypothetical protein
VPTDEAPDLSEFHTLTEVDELRKVNTTLQIQLRKAKARSDALVDATFHGARDAMIALGPISPVEIGVPDNRRKHGEVALWDLGDWQGAKLTTSYNSEVMRTRVLRFCDKADILTAIARADHPVKECVILFGGDMCEGLFNFPTQPFEIDATIFGQFVNVSRLCVDVVRRALHLYDKVTVCAEWGNHGRIGSKRATVPGSDNFDRMIYEMSRQLLAGEKRLTWDDCPEDIQHLQIGNYRALVIHGDEIGRNGFASKNTIVQHVNRWRSGAHPWAFRDVYCHHYHTHGEESMANGEGSVYWTGSTESDNRYAGVNLAASAIPSQRLHFVDPDRGRVTAGYRIWLDD